MTVAGEGTRSVSAILLDTHTFLWALSDSIELSPGARDLLADREIETYLSLASVWEIAIKSGLGKLRLPAPLQECINKARATGLRLAPIELSHALGVERLPLHHRDPFDRLLASQCLSDGFTLVSRDAVFDDYGVRRLW